MKIWYRAVCDKCGVADMILVSNPTCSTTYLDCGRVQRFLENHIECNLRLVKNDFELDQLWEAGWDYDPIDESGNRLIK